MPANEASSAPSHEVSWFATKGSGTNEALRLRTLLSAIPGSKELLFRKTAKLTSFVALLRTIRRQRPRLLVMEGTGIAGGLVCLLGRLLWKVPYVFSSGDAVGPFIGAHHSGLELAFGVYERLLCRMAAGFIGWTPYLCGRALTFGCPRAVTAAGWPIGSVQRIDAPLSRAQFREEWKIPTNALVVGIVGALDWNVRRRYCYGLELVKAACQLRRDDLVVVVVGGGSGTEHLKQMAGNLLGTRIILPGPVPLADVLPCLSAFDVASLPQSTDSVGAFRYTTKLSEYAAAGLPVITSRIPVAYDLGMHWMWRLPGDGPWTEQYVNALAELLQRLDQEQIAQRRIAIPERLESFDRTGQIERVTAFIDEILSDNVVRS